MYTLISFIPANKRESNYSTTLAEQDWTFYSTSGIAGSIATPRLSRSISSLPSKVGYSSAQAVADQKMRAAENRLLANNAASPSRQLALTASVASNSDIGVDTVWSGMYIYVYDAASENMIIDTINATCRKESTNAYFFVDDTNFGVEITGPMLDSYGSKFDEIYNKNRSKFGYERDVDNNDKVIIVLTSKITDGVLGYFNSNDKYANSSSNPHSNEGDIFYLTALSVHQPHIPATMAHEFQHMIYFDQHYNAGTTFSFIWLNEALSQAAEYYNDEVESHEGWIRNFLENNPQGGWYGLSLTNWTNDNYGYGAIFIRYLIDQFGDTAIRNMCSTGKVGIAAVEAATGVDFNTIFYNFTLALALSGTDATGDSRFNFSLDLQGLQALSANETAINPYSGTGFPISAGTSFSWWNYPYEIFYFKRTGSFNTVALTGTDIIGTAFDLD